MSKKHFIFAADLVVENMKNNTYDSQFYKQTDTYKAFERLFKEFGKNFNIATFDSYIEKKLGI